MSVRLTLLLILAFTPSLGYAATWYAGPSGSGTACTTGSPCTIAQGLATVAPGDTLILKNGTYAASGQTLAWAGTRSGSTCTSFKGGTSDSARVTIQAETAGLAIIDGEYARETGRWDCVRYTTLSGVRVQNSLRGVMTLDYSTNNIITGTSMYNGNYYAAPDTSVCPGAVYYNYHVMLISVGSDYNVIEDNIFSGSGRNLLQTFHADFVIMRRNLLIGGAWTRGSGGGPGCASIAASQHGEPMQIYNSSDNVSENNIAYSFDTWAGHQRYTPAGTNIWVNTGSNVGYRNKYLGMVVMNIPSYAYYNSSTCTVTNGDICITDSVFENIVAYRAGEGLYIVNGQNIQANYVSVIQSGLGAGAVSTLKAGLVFNEKQDDDKSSNYVVKNVLISGGVLGCYGWSLLQAGDAVLNYALLHGNTTNYNSDCTTRVTKTNITTGVDPLINSIAYVKPGSPALTAGEGGGRVGADTRCRYISSFNGTAIVTNHTTESLWPLPSAMNTRAINETLEILGVSYDMNALVLDALSPRVTGELPCPNATPPLEPAEYVSATGTTSVTYDHNFAAGTDHVLVCAGLWDSANNVGEVSSLTIGGEALTRLSGGRVMTSPAFRAAELWGKATPLTGVRSVVVNTTGDVDGLVVTSIALEPWTSTGAVVSSTGLGTAPSATAVTTSTDHIIDCLAMSSTPTATQGANQTLETNTVHPTQSLRLASSNQLGSAGGLMDWVLSSNTYYAHLAVSGASGTPPTYTFRVTKFKGSSLHGSTATPEVAIHEHGSGGVGVTVAAGGSLRLRTETTVEVADSPPTGIALYCRKAAETFGLITESYGANPVKLIGNVPITTIPNPGTATTQQLSVGSYTPHAVVRLEGLPQPLPAITTNNKTETDWLLDVDPSLTVGTVVECQVRFDTGVIIGTHTVTPAFTVRGASASSGF
jgi:hypothetical protein